MNLQSLQDADYIHILTSRLDRPRYQMLWLDSRINCRIENDRLDKQVNYMNLRQLAITNFKEIQVDHNKGDVGRI